MVELVLKDEMRLFCIAIPSTLVSLLRSLRMMLGLPTYFSEFRQYVLIILNF